MAGVQGVSEDPTQDLLQRQVLGVLEGHTSKNPLDGGFYGKKGR